MLYNYDFYIYTLPMKVKLVVWSLHNTNIFTRWILNLIVEIYCIVYSKVVSNTKYNI